LAQLKENHMGKGDKRTTKGKRYNSSYGKTRPRRASSVSPEAATPKTAVAKKTAARKRA